MHHMIQKTIAAILAAALMLPSLTAGAAYQSKDEIAFSLRGIAPADGSYLVEEDTIFLTPESAAAGTQLQIGMYIEAEYADLAYIYGKVQPDTPEITFIGDAFVNPTVTAWTEPVTYTLADGTTFSTKFKPYALGKLSGTSYHHDSMGLTANFPADENSFNFTWMYGYSDLQTMSAGFLSGRSDAFSLLDLDLQVAPGIEPGVHHISFVSDAEGDDFGATYLTSDDSVGGKSVYNSMIPTLKNLRVVSPMFGDANMDGLVNAADAAEVLVYSTAKGAGEKAVLYSEGNAELERLAYYCADVDEHSTTCGEGDGTALNATDAAAILVYAVIAGSGETPDWEDILQ